MIVAVFMFATTLSMADDVKLEYVLEGIKYNDSIVKNCSIKMSYIEETTKSTEGNNAFRDLLSKDPEAPLPPLLQKEERQYYEYNIVLKGQKLKIEEKHYEYSPKNEREPIKLLYHYLFAYDGEKTRRIYYFPEDETKLEAAISSEPISSSYGRDAIPLVFTDFLGSTLSQYPEMKLIEKTRMDGYDCYLLEGPHIRGNKKVKIWVAPEIGFRPLRIESSTDMFEIITKAEYENYNGIWAVKHRTYQSFLKKSPNTDNLLKLFKRELTVKKAEFIAPPEEIPDSVFVLEFPPQLEKIWDVDTETYIDVSSLEDKDTSLE